MSEESILILNMLREGKVTAEQADSLLRAVRETAPPPSSAPSPPPAAAPPPVTPPTPDPVAMASMQAKLAELQGKLGDLQGKLGAAQAVRSAGQAASFAGKVLDHLPKPDLDMGKINKAVDEAMRGLNSLKNDAVRTAKTAARQAGQEARRAAREGRKAMKFDFNLDFGHDAAEQRPTNTGGLPEVNETQHSDETWDGADAIVISNPYGAVTVRGEERGEHSANVTTTRTAWAGTESEARVLLQQVFLTTDVQNGKWRARIIAPADAQDRITVDCEIVVPRYLPLEVTTTYGAIAVHGTSSALVAKSGAGAVSVDHVWGEGGGETRVTTVSGAIKVADWNVPGGTLLVETSSGDIEAEGVTGETASLTSRSGDLTVRKAQAVGMASFESASGDVSVTNAGAGTRAHIRTQSGQAVVDGLRAAQIQIETVSGDADIRTLAGTVTVKTVSGDVKAASVESPAVSLLTVSGDAQWAFAGPFSGSFAGTTVSGDLTLDLTSSSDARIEMNTTNGALSMGIPVADMIVNDKHATGKLGEGIGSVRLQSVSGDLKINEGK